MESCSTSTVLLWQLCKKTTDPVVAEGVHAIVIFHCMTACARPGVAEGGERVDSHTNEGCALEGLVVQAEGGSVGGDVEPHAVVWRFCGGRPVPGGLAKATSVLRGRLR
jgi:hypothetical protein